MIDYETATLNYTSQDGPKPLTVQIINVNTLGELRSIVIAVNDKGEVYKLSEISG